MSRLVKYQHNGLNGLQAIADHYGIKLATLHNRLNVQGLTLEHAIEIGPGTRKSKQKEDSYTMVFVNHRSKRCISKPEFTPLQKLVFGLSFNNESVAF